MQNLLQSLLYMHHIIADVLLPAYRRQVLGLLLLRPDEELHGREVARRIGLPAGSVARELNRLTDAGLLQRRKQGNQQVYRANLACPINPELASILRKTSGLGDVLTQALAPLAHQIRVGFVFGSMAQGRASAGSDVDVMLIGELGFRQVVELLHPVQASLGREVNPKVMTPTEFQAQASTAFLREVLSKPKIFLIGNDHDLEELAGHQP
jgi:predicted nucleotidyltransferase